MDTVIYGIAEIMLSKNRSLGISAHKIAREEVERLWNDPRQRVAMAPGKAVLGKLSNWCQQNCGASFGAPAIARNFHAHEIPPEIATVLEAIENGVAFGD